MTHRPLELDVLFSESWNDFTANLGGYALAELAKLSVLGLAAVASWLVAIGLLGAFMCFYLGLLILGGLLAWAVDGQVVVPVVMLMMFVGQMAGYTLGFLLFVAGVGGAAGLFVPLQLSLYRAVADHHAGRQALGASAAWSGALRALPTTLAIVFVVVVLIAVSQLTLLLPLLLAALFLGFVLPAVALHDCGVTAAFAHNLRAFGRDPGAFVLLGFIAAAVTFASGFVPVLGGGYALAFRMRAARFLVSS